MAGWPLVAGKSWELSGTLLPHDGEAQLAEVRKPNGHTAVLFSGRSNEGSHEHSPRGIAWSYDDGTTFTSVRIADDLTAGITCLASIRSLERQHSGNSADTRGTTGSSLLFSHPSSGTNRSAGVLLRSENDAESWQIVSFATPEQPGANFGYSNLNALPKEVASDSVTPLASTPTLVGVTYETGDPGCEAPPPLARLSTAPSKFRV